MTSRVYTDPGCYTVTSNDGSPLIIGQKRETRGERSGTCREDTSAYNFIANKTERTSFAASFGHSFSDQAEFYSFGHYSDATTLRADDGYNSSRGPTVFLAWPSPVPICATRLSASMPLAKPWNWVSLHRKWV